MSATDYFVTPNDIGRSIVRIRWEHGLGVAAGLLTAFLVYKFTGLGVEAAIFGALLISLMVWRSDPRWLFGAAIGSFGAIIIVSTLWRDMEVYDKPLSERMAVWSFYFLVIGVMLLIVESYWPKDGTFNAHNQKAPSAAKNNKHPKLPAHVKAKLKRQREEVATAQASIAQQLSQQEDGGFKHPLFANGQPPINRSVAVEQTVRHRPKSDGPLFQYIAQSPPKLRPAPENRPLPQSVVTAPTHQDPRPIQQMQSSQPRVSPAVAKQAPRIAIPRPPKQPPKHVQSAPDKPKAAPPLLDLRSAQRFAPPRHAGQASGSIKVAIKSDSPLPSKRRKLVQL